MPLKLLVDNALGTEPIPGLLASLVPAGLRDSAADVIVIALVLLIVITIIDQLQQLFYYLLYTLLGERLVLLFRTHLFSNVQRLSLAYHDTQGTADSLYRIQYD